MAPVIGVRSSTPFPAHYYVRKTYSLTMRINVLQVSRNLENVDSCNYRRRREDTPPKIIFSQSNPNLSNPSSESITLFFCSRFSKNISMI